MEGMDIDAENASLQGGCERLCYCCISFIFAPRAVYAATSAISTAFFVCEDFGCYELGALSSSKIPPNTVWMFV